MMDDNTFTFLMLLTMLTFIAVIFKIMADSDKKVENNE